MSSDRRDELTGQTMIDLAIAYDLLSQSLEKELRPLGLNMTQLSLLFHFSWKPERSQTVSQLLKVMGINQPGITKATSAMVAKGLLRKESDSEDARVKHLFITKKGLRILELAKETTFPVLVENFSCLNNSELGSLAGNLRTLARWLDEKREL